MHHRYPISHGGRRLAVEKLEARLVLSGGGLTAQYFHNSDFTGLADTRTEAVAFNWGTSNPAPGVDAESFSVRWTGQIEPQFSETYTFRVLSDEGVRVWIDGQLIIDDWSPHLRRNASGTIALESGQRYDIRVEYFDVSGPAQIELSWSSPSQPMQIVPAGRLYTSPHGLLGTYSDSAQGKLTRVDATVNFNWGLAAPAAGLARDGLSVTWSGQLRPSFSEMYTFSTISDERVRLWIGGELVIDHWTDHAVTEDFGKKHLEAGKWYDLRLEFYDVTGHAEIHLRWSSARQTVIDAFEVIPATHLRAMKPAPVLFENPLGVGADPFVIRWQDHYYMTRSTGTQVWINRAASLQDIHHSSLGSDTVLAWSPPPGTNYSDQVWAPELHRFGESWYIYVAASNGNNATHRMHVLQRTADDPFGPFTYVGQISAATDRWAIDGTAFEWDDKLYFVWSGWPGFTDGQQNLYIAEMRNPWTLRGDRVLISSPQYAWEKHGLAINEGPQMLIHDGKLQIIYSASGFWTPQYALGSLTYNGTGSLLDPASWTKSPQPVFQAANGVVGVGHASFTVSPDESEHWIVYHAHRNPPPSQGEIRDIRIQPFTFDPDGMPNFGAPLPPGLPLSAPSIGPDPDRPFVQGDYNADGIVNGQDYNTWRATFGLEVFAGTGADGNGNGVVDAADFVIWRRAASALGSAGSVVADTGQTEDAAHGATPPVRKAAERAPVEVVIDRSAGTIGILDSRWKRVLARQHPIDAIFESWPNLIDWDSRRWAPWNRRQEALRLAAGHERDEADAPYATTDLNSRLEHRLLDGASPQL